MTTLAEYKEHKKQLLQNYGKEPESIAGSIQAGFKKLEKSTGLTSPKKPAEKQPRQAITPSGRAKSQDWNEQKRAAAHSENQRIADQKQNARNSRKIDAVATATTEGSDAVVSAITAGFKAQNKLLKDIAKKLDANGTGSRGLIDDALSLLSLKKGLPPGTTGGAGKAASKILTEAEKRAVLEAEKAALKARPGFLKRTATALEEGGGRFSGLPNAVRRGMSALETATSKAVLSGKGLLSEASASAGKALSNARPMMEPLTSGVSKAVNAGKSLLEPAAEYGSKALAQGKSLLTPVAEYGSKALSAGTSAGSKLLDAGKSIFSSAKSAVPAVADGGTSALSGLKDGARNVLGSVKGMANLGGLLSVATAGYDEYQLLNDDTKSTKEKAVGTAGIAGGTAGGIAGAELGAAIGTAVAPVIGTAVGGILGGIGGYLAGSGLAESAAEFVSESVEDSGLGDIIGRGAAIAMSPFSEEARSALVSDWQNNVTPILDSAGKKFDSASAGVAAAFVDIVPSMSKVGDKFAAAGDGVVSSFKEVGPTVMTALSPIAGLAAAITGMNFDEVMSKMNKGLTDLNQEFDDTTKSLGVASSGVWSSIKNTASNAVDSGKTALGQIKTGFEKDGLTGATTAASDAAKTAWADSKKAMGQLTTDMSISRGVAVGRWTPDEMAAMQAAQSGGEKFRAGQGLDQATKDKITASAAKHGIDPSHLMAMAQMESGGNSKAVSATGAAGLFQFTGGTGKQYGITNRFDADQNIDAAARLYKDNAASLKKQGIEPTLDNVYLAHQQGAGGASQIIKAAQGQGQVSETVAKNMGLNVGGGAGSVQGFINANHNALAAASKKASTFTAEPYKDTSSTNAVATAAPNTQKPQPKTGTSPEPVKTAATSPLPPTGAGGGRGGGSYAAQVVAQTANTPKAETSPVTPSVATSSPTGKTVPTAIVTQQPIQMASVSTPAPPMVASTLPQEVSRVQVTNQPEPAAPAAPTQVAQRGGGNSGSRGTPGLDDVPAFFPDSALVPLLIGLT